MAKMKKEDMGVKVGDEIIVKGVVTYARLDKLVDGNDLVRENERRAKIGQLVANKPFRSITIENVEVIKGQGTPLEAFYGQSVYQSKTSGKQTLSLESKSKYPPSYAHLQNGVVVQIPDPEKNPATGQVVYIKLTAFASSPNMGSSFDAIMFEEGPIKFYEGTTKALASFGDAFNSEVQPMAEQPMENETHFGIQDDAVNTNGFNSAPVYDTQQTNQQPQQQQNTTTNGFNQQPTGFTPQNNQQQQPPTTNGFNQSQVNGFTQQPNQQQNNQAAPTNGFAQPQQPGFGQGQMPNSQNTGIGAASPFEE